jgi:hypothetical protein
MINSLKASIPFLADILRLNPHAIYERQRALVKERVLKSVPGRGPGSGTFFTPETAAVLFISMLATDSIKDCVEKTNALSAVKLETYTIGLENPLGGAKTFKAAIVNALSSDAVAAEIVRIRIYRRNFAAEVWLNDTEPWEDPPAGKIFTTYEIEQAERVCFFRPKKETYSDRDGLAVMVEIIGSQTFEKIRALLRDNEKVANVATAEASAQKNAPRKSRMKGHRK